MHIILLTPDLYKKFLNDHSSSFIHVEASPQPIKHLEKGGYNQDSTFEKLVCYPVENQKETNSMGYMNPDVSLLRKFITPENLSSL